MSLKLKKRDEEPLIRKVLIYGRPGHGKSTFASNYCKKHNLKPLILDIDNTNHTGDDIAEVDLSNDIKTYKSLRDIIKEVKQHDYDTIVIDGLGSLLEQLVSKARGQAKFGDRAERFNNIFNDLIKSNLNLIFIGQEDCNLENYVENLPNKSIIKVNSIVNEIYYCVKGENGYTNTVDKFRKEIENIGKNKDTPVKSPKKETPKTPDTPKTPKPPTEPEGVQDAEYTKKDTEKEEPKEPPITELEIEQEKTISNDKIGNEAINRLIQKKKTINQDNLVGEVRDMLGEELITPPEAGKAQKIINNA